MNKSLVIIIVLIIAGFGAGWLLREQTFIEKIEDTLPPPVACTMEAKLCPDGSTVGRTGPNCEFAPCPAGPVGRECSGPDDASCPAGFECEAGCGPPVVRYPDDTPIKYFCELKGYERPCPICLAKGARIDTPAGEIAVEDLKVGDAVWTTDKSGKRAAGTILKTSKTPVPPTHQMAHLVFDDGRELFVSPGHSTTDGRTVGELKPGDAYGGARVLSAALTPYAERYTYDILSSGDTGFYFANDILLSSTLH